MSTTENTTHSSQDTQNTTEPTSDEPTPEVTTKYGSTGTATAEDTTPDLFTENAEELRAEFLGHDNDSDVDDPAPNPTHNDSKHKYGHLVGDVDTEQIPEEKQTPNSGSRTEHIPKASTHAENRFYSRSKNTSYEDAPNNIYEAWRTGVRVGIEHYELDNFYSYHTAMYHEIADVIMIMNDDGIIETTINNFEETVIINTDHLLRCGDPECNRLYNRQEESVCCHWCGYSKEQGKNPSEVKLLPQKR